MKRRLWLVLIILMGICGKATPSLAVEKLNNSQMDVVRGGDPSAKQCETMMCQSAGPAKTCEYNAVRETCETVEPKNVWGCAGSSCHYACFPKGYNGVCEDDKTWGANLDPQKPHCDCTQTPMVSNPVVGQPDDCTDEYHTDCGPVTA